VQRPDRTVDPRWGPEGGHDQPRAAGRGTEPPGRGHEPGCRQSGALGLGSSAHETTIAPGYDARPRSAPRNVPIWLKVAGPGTETRLRDPFEGGQPGGMVRTRRGATRRVPLQKLVLSASLLAASGAIVGFGAFATFTSTASTSPTISSGTVTLAPINTSAANNRLSVGASGLAAGDTVQRAVDLKNTGSISIVAPTLTTTATASSLLDTDTTNGLQMVIDKCSVAWTETGGPPYTYTCGGTTSSVLASVPVIGASLALSNITTTANTDNYLRVTLTLPSGSPNTEQNQSSTIQFTFTATQRAAQAQ